LRPLARRHNYLKERRFGYFRHFRLA
jgi:hypothetical protein